MALTCHSINIAKKEQVSRFVHYGFEHRSLARVRKAFISLRDAFASLLSWVMLRKLWVFVYLMMKIFLGPVYFKPFISLRHRFVTCYRSHYKKIRKRYAIQSTRGFPSAFSDAAIRSRPCVRWPLSACSNAAISLRDCVSGATVSAAQRHILVFTIILSNHRAGRGSRSSVRFLTVWYTIHEARMLFLPLSRRGSAARA